MKKLILSLGLAGVLVFGCKTLDQAELKHDWGKTSRVGNDHKFQDCKLSYDTTHVYRDTRTYVQNVLRHIMKANPEVFKPGSPLDPQKILDCVVVNDSEEISAVALVPSRSIEVPTGRIMNLESDTELASTLAHELAHITMLHNEMAHPKLKGDKEVIELLKRSKALLGTIVKVTYQITEKANEIHKILDAAGKRDLFSYLDESSFNKVIDRFGNINQSAYSDFRNSIVAKLDASTGAKVGKYLDEIMDLRISIADEFADLNRVEQRINAKTIKVPGLQLDEALSFKEQEADEVGYEFFKRACMKDEGVLARYRTYLLAEQDGKPEKEKMKTLMVWYDLILKAEVLGEEYKGKRGSNSHPKTHWRLFDYYRERRIHAAELKKLKCQQEYGAIPGSGFSAARFEIETKSRYFKKDEDNKDTTGESILMKDVFKSSSSGSSILNGGVFKRNNEK